MTLYRYFPGKGELRDVMLDTVYGELPRREVDGEAEHLRVPMPCVLTAQKGLAEPRLPGLKGIMASKKKPLEVLAQPLAEALTQVSALSLPPARGGLTRIEPTPAGMQQLLTALRNERKVL